MAKTQPTGEQIRFRSANTGEHVLDTYLESAEIGGRNLTDLLDDLFDPSNNGTFRASNFEFRFDPSTDKLQFRVGQFASATAGFTDLTTFFSIEGTFSTSTTYNNFDVVTLSNKDVYIVHGLSSGTTFSSESNFISSANTEKLVDVSSAQDWASKVNGIVDSTDYSSKAYAIGGTGVDTGSGSAKDWAIKTSGTVGNTSENSAKYHATAAASSASTATTQANLATTNGAAQVTLATAQVALATTQANNSASSASASSTSATNSANSASAASTSETNAAASAATATTQAGLATTNGAAQVALATTQAGLATSNGAAQVALATTQANNAASSATAASNSQTAAAASAASAANSYDSFDDRYLGPKTSNPSQDNDGNSLVAGALYFNSNNNEMRVFDGGNWIAASSAGTASLLIYKYTATSNQTSFGGSDDASNSLSYTIDNIIVTLNGVVLEVGTDVTATNGTTVVLASGAAANDELNIYAFKSFTTADMVSKSNGGIFQGNVDFAAGIDVTGNITATGTVDGRDLQTDGTKLDGIEASADVTDTTNVVAALTAGTGINIAGNGTISNTASTDLVSDTSPQLGANLDTNNFDIVTTSNRDIDLAPNGTGKVVVKGNTNPGTVVFNCELNSHGQTVKSQPHSASVTNTLTLPAGSDQEIVGTTATQTLTNKTLTSPVLTSATISNNILATTGTTSIRPAGTEIVTINNTGDITVKGQGSSRAMMVLQAGSNTSNSQLRFGDQAVDSAGRILYDHSNNFMRFDTNESEKMRLLSSGFLGLNTSSPSAMLHVVSSDLTSAKFETSNGNSITLGYDNLSASRTGDFFIDNRSASGNNLQYRCGSSAAHIFNIGTSEKARVTSSGVSVTGTLAATALTGDGSALTGVEAFPSGTRMLFQQSAAPTGWTKDTTSHNNKAIRCVTGNVSSGGSNNFTTAFGARTVSVSGTTGNTNATISGSGTTGNTNASISGSGTTGNTSLSIAQLPSHRHGVAITSGVANVGTHAGNSIAAYSGGGQNMGQYASGFIGKFSEYQGSGNSHNHSFSFSGSSNHNHSFSFSGSSNHSHSFSASGTASINVQYFDVIIAQKN